MSANSKQVGGGHYSADIQHWDFVASNQLDYFQGQITKYISRMWKKNRMEDFEKAEHFMQKYRELIEAGYSPSGHTAIEPAVGEGEPTKGYVDQGRD